MGVYRQIETGLSQNPGLFFNKNSIEQTFLQFSFGHFNIGKVTMTSALVDVKRLAFNWANIFAIFVWVFQHRQSHNDVCACWRKTFSNFCKCTSFYGNRLGNSVWANFSAHLFGQLFRQILFRQHFWHFHFDNFSEFVWATLLAIKLGN